MFIMRDVGRCRRKMSFTCPSFIVPMVVPHVMEGNHVGEWTGIDLVTPYWQLIAPRSSGVINSYPEAH